MFFSSSTMRMVATAGTSGTARKGCGKTAALWAKGVGETRGSDIAIPCRASDLPASVRFDSERHRRYRRGRHSWWGGRHAADGVGARARRGGALVRGVSSRVPEVQLGRAVQGAQG